MSGTSTGALAGRTALVTGGSSGIDEIQLDVSDSAAWAEFPQPALGVI